MLLLTSLNDFKKYFSSIPLPSSISFVWNFGSLLGVSLLIQIISGVFLSFHYSSSIEMAFKSVISLSESVECGWLIRSIHSNGASFFFLMAFAHISRGIYYGSFNLKEVWLVGVTLFLLLMGTAFVGYVLPWGQMSYWGATVITNLVSAFPYGDKMVVWIWGGFSVSAPTLSRFYSFHFVLPFLVLGLSMVHVVFLHKSGSSNPLGISIDSDKVFFHPYYTVKDLLGIIVLFFPLISISVVCPDLFMDPDNFIPANPMVTPQHIQPEWYFLFAYTILRSIPNKLGGVIALISSVGILYLLPLLKGASSRFSVLKGVLFWSFVFVFLGLTLLGSVSVDEKLLPICQFLTGSYFILILLLGVV